ncbi:DUF1761 domain-containing protein [Primorskyibacter sp. S187A]|uniref:DUF1761 domain-containing protein n=1 Tax=Primorskyibacter sp. S187A TaxID=3415130 RepID=UPI003C7CA4A9
MDVINVIVAGLASFAFGAVWYSVFATAWKDASGVALDAEANPANQKSPVPYVTAVVASIIVAGMMRHVFELSAIDTVGKSIQSGLGIGAFLAAPWLATNYGFAGRPFKLLLIDGGYATFGCGIIGLVLALF